MNTTQRPTLKTDTQHVLKSGDEYAKDWGGDHTKELSQARRFHADWLQSTCWRWWDLGYEAVPLN